jgi:hypothetical protein
MSEAKQRGVSVGDQLVSHHPVLDDRLLPLVFEDIRWIPHEYASRHPLAFGRQWRTRRDHFDRSAFAGVDHRLTEPLLAFARVGDGRPDHLDRKRQAAFEVQHRAVTVDGQPSVALTHCDSLCLRSRCRSRRPLNKAVLGLGGPRWKGREVRCVGAEIVSGRAMPSVADSRGSRVRSRSSPGGRPFQVVCGVRVQTPVVRVRPRPTRLRRLSPAVRWESQAWFFWVPR